MNYLLALLTALIGSVLVAEAQATAGQAPADIEPTISYLIDVVASSEQTFVRNSTRYSAAEAAQHLRRKYQHFRARIQTVDDFIELAASRSLMTGKPYLVVDNTGNAIPVSQWLRQVLSEYCDGRAGDASPSANRNAAIQCAE